MYVYAFNSQFHFTSQFHIKTQGRKNKASVISVDAGCIYHILLEYVSMPQNAVLQFAHRLASIRNIYVRIYLGSTDFNIRKKLTEAVKRL